MKNITLTLALLFSVILFAQEQKIEPIFEKQDNMVKATYFHGNGEVAQTGFYLDGKLQGEWVSYDKEGKKTAIANYDQGKKAGKWFFWSDGKLSEVDYTDNRIANVTTWSSESQLVKNK
ncbi:toxin-antitoxin system YwqK family antitoxin [Zhouia amylolytica]|uniref:toxin-antitoxin system YwqK family antitoxin n=1 Tax=Zhouia amylolytica TaxID=376730 RepID=UPI0020CC1BBC|nr:nicotinic acid mononucleotide adenyltransferase [Zhouia amylolytica]MCQ0110314.1 nicotinic acid mononucleotide adenyltransferase [Zhouia amylolytica]